MKNTTKLNDTYKVIIKKEKGCNIVHIFEKNKLFAGTGFSENATKESIIDWAKNFIISQSKDLFPHWEILPNKVKDILQTFSDETYDECDTLLSQLKPLGYTFEYYLDAIPYNLTIIK